MKKIPETGIYPFWFWNGQIKEEEILRQLELIRNSGCRGAVIHARKGNKIPYLSERWFELVRYTCSHAGKKGLKIWIYDEDGYPSGNAGGKVQALHPEVMQKSLLFQYEGTDPEQPAFAAYDPESYQRLDETRVPANTPALRFHLKELAAHVDTLNPLSAELFLKITHERYYQELHDFFGSVIEAFYTDDVSFLSCLTSGYVFSPVLEKEWHRRYGQSVLESLPFLVEELPGSSEIRTRYFRLAQELFLKNFIIPQRQWCNEHGVCYIGHLCYDEGPQNSSICSFTSAMPFMKNQDVPSIDDFLLEMSDQRYLGRPYNDDSLRVLHVGNRRLASLKTYKQGASIAHQFGTGKLSAETLTYLLWEISPDFLNLQMFFELGMGVNLITPHAFYYTIGDVAGYDSVPSYFFQQPWFSHCNLMFSTWTHIAELLIQGNFHCKVLVLEPSGDIGAMCGKEVLADFPMQTREPRESVHEIHDVLIRVIQLLLRRHVGFDLGDEVLVAENAIAGNGVLKVGNMNYDTVILTDQEHLSGRMRNILDDFQKSGGMLLDSRNDDLDCLTPDIHLTGAGTEEILVHTRNNAGFQEVFMLNLSGKDLQPELNYEGTFSVYDPLSRKSFHAESHLPNGFTLRAGDLCMLMPPKADGDRPWTESRYIPLDRGRKHPELKYIRPLNDNIFPIHPRKNFELLVPDYANIKLLYAEKLSESKIFINGKAVASTPGCHHPADPAFEAGNVEGLFLHGVNKILFEKSSDIVRLAGNFQVVRAEYPWGLGKMDLQLGDLSAQGYPFYWGAIEYTFTFQGSYDFVEVKMQGTAEVFVNGKSCGYIYGKPFLLFIGNACVRGENELRIQLCNTAQNFVRAESPVPFGIYDVKLKNNLNGSTCQ